MDEIICLLAEAFLPFSAVGLVLIVLILLYRAGRKVVLLFRRRGKANSVPPAAEGGQRC